jgi:hypothetical protein
MYLMRNYWHNAYCSIIIIIQYQFFLTAQFNSQHHHYYYRGGIRMTTNIKKSFLNSINKKLIVCIILSFFAALGTVSYGYQFAKYLQPPSTAMQMSLGAIFALSAMLANMMLGTYSLLNIKSKNNQKIQLPILLVSSVGAIPYGFLCYFGYQNVLPSVVNIAIGSIVVIVNAGIGYTAIQNLWLSVKKSLTKKTADKTPKMKTAIQVIGFSIGFAISLLTYLAASSGITDLFIHYKLDTLVEYKAGFLLAILAWIPPAALFANANQVVAGELYDKIGDFQKFLRSINKTSLAFFIFCLCSGTAIAQMTADSFAPSKNIPEIFKAEMIQFLVQYLIPISLLSSAALNYFSINKFFENVKGK